MRTSFTPEERGKILGWLDHGVELARARFGARATVRQVIWQLITDSLDLLDRVPDQEKRWLSSGTRSGGWNAVGMTKVELVEIERLRVLSAMKPFDGQTRYLPQKDDVSRSLGVLEWLRWCSRGDDHSLQKAAVLLAKGSEDLAIKALPRFDQSRRRQAAYEIRNRVTGRILQGLKDDAGIVPAAAGLRFVEVARADA